MPEETVKVEPEVKTPDTETPPTDVVANVEAVKTEDVPAALGVATSN